jgi:threonylcarbamoyladenosine tRNA methylthiotransferase MtaB
MRPFSSEPPAASHPADPRPRAALESLGCRLNHSETEVIRQRLEQAGYRIVPWGEPADVMVVNSCTVTAEADATSRQALRKARRIQPTAQLAIVGCHAQLHATELAAEGLADLIVGNADKLSVVEQLQAASTSSDPALPSGPRVVRTPFSRQAFAFEFDPDALVSDDGGTRAHLKIQDGCDFMCSFCIIPKARGRARPRAFANLMAEAEALAERGAQEIVLTGVNLGTYDEDGLDLVQVIDRLDALPGVARLRISSIEPTTVMEGILERMAAPGHKLAPFLHLPLQSGSERVLSAMRRRYTAAQYEAFAERALAQVPDLCLGADVMAGFPGETDTEFGETFDLIGRLPFAYLHVFGYSPRPGTPAALMPEPIAPAVRDRRVAALRALSDAKRMEYHRRFLGRSADVLFEKPRRPDMAEGYTAHYVRVRVHTPDAAALRNRILPVKLLESGAHAVAGEIVATAF